MSSSFIYVPDFYKFYSSRVESAEFQKQESVINAAKEGDVVLLKRASSGARYHAIYIFQKKIMEKHITVVIQGPGKITTLHI